MQDTEPPILLTEAMMANKNRNRLNQPPTGEGKKQSPHSGEANKLHKRAEVLQAQSGRTKHWHCGRRGGFRISIRESEAT
jgi:hypothetical protein